MTVDMAVKMGAVALKNPLMTASGTFGYASEFAEVCDVGRLGGVVTKGISLRPRAEGARGRVGTPRALLARREGSALPWRSTGSPSPG